MFNIIFALERADMPETQRSEINLINYNVSRMLCRMHGLEWNETGHTSAKRNVINGLL
jgi:hypothetical protein